MRIREFGAILHDRLFNDFVTLFVVINPIGTVPLFIAVTRHEPAQTIRKTALRSVVISAIILLTFVVIGQMLLSALEIELGAFRIAGGLVLLIISLRMVLESTHQPTEEKSKSVAGMTLPYSRWPRRSSPVPGASWPPCCSRTTPCTAFRSRWARRS